MDFLKVLILGIVEGITEFLPVSSTGHLILVHEFIDLQPARFSNAFDVIIQLGAIMSVVVLYFNKLNPFSGKSTMEESDYRQKYGYTMRLWVKVVVGVIPAGVLGFLFDDFIDQYLFNPIVVAFALLLWGIVLVIMENKNKNKVAKYQTIDHVPLKIAFLIGIFQCLAMIPGTSRSAATIIGAMLLGTSRVAAAEFSFFLAIPTMLGATLLKVIKLGGGFTNLQWILIIWGGIVSFITALIVIKEFMGYIKKNDFKIFGYYRIVLGLLVLLYFTIIN